MEELASSYGFPASAFPKEGFSLNTHFVLTLTVHGSGMTFVTAEAPWKDLLSSGLFPGSSGKVSVFSLAYGFLASFHSNGSGILAFCCSFVFLPQYRQDLGTKEGCFFSGRFYADLNHTPI